MKKSTKHLVILVHGIRDIGRWQSEIRVPLEQNGFLVELTNYDRMNLLEFLSPISVFRRKAKEKVLTQIRNALTLHPGCKVSIIAHSFGTYVVSEILSEAFDLRFYRVIFCGSVVKNDLPFEQYKGRFRPPLLNDVGTSDPWPALAESITFGFGSAGTYGFRVPGVRDRFQNGGGHGYFLNKKYCAENWIPFLLDSPNAPMGDENPAQPPFWVRLISIVKLRYLIVTAIVVSVLIFSVSKIWTPTRYTYNFNASGSRFTYWNAPIQQLLRDVSFGCPGPSWLCKSSWLSEDLFKRQFLPIHNVDNDITKIVSCRSFVFPNEGTPVADAYDPLKALRKLADSFPRCISLTRDPASGGYVLKINHEELLRVHRQDGELALLCDCPPETAQNFK